MLAFEQVDNLLHCDDATGLLIRKKRTTNSVSVGDIAGYTQPNGYVVVGVNGTHYGAHRIVWLLKTGTWPTGEIDHIDGDPSNNRFSNLRHSDHRSNLRNQKRRSTNTSGINGVYYSAKHDRWYAHISDDTKKHLGSFLTKEDAVEARKAAEIEYGYHPNHGKRK